MSTPRKTREYRFATDSQAGTIKAISFVDAKRQLRAMLPFTVIANGGWGWVCDEDGYRFAINC